MDELDMGKLGAYLEKAKHPSSIQYDLAQYSEDRVFRVVYIDTTILVVGEFYSSFASLLLSWLGYTPTLHLNKERLINEVIKIKYTNYELLNRNRYLFVFTHMESIPEHVERQIKQVLREWSISPALFYFVGKDKSKCTTACHWTCDHWTSETISEMERMTENLGSIF